MVYRCKNRFRLDREHRVLDRQFTGYCNYGSLLDAMIRYAIEARQLDTTRCLLNIAGADYQRCWQTFLVAMEY